MQPALTSPRLVLITLDAVGGVWRYAMDVARGLQSHGVRCLLVGFGPRPGAGQRAECEGLDLIWIDEPLDWMVSDGAMLDAATQKLSALADERNVDLLHLNAPSQAAGIATDRPVVVASHSCVPSWWKAVRGADLPEAWAWQWQRNRDGLLRADAVLVPSESHAGTLANVYGRLPALHVIHNATTVSPADHRKETLILAAGRWWDAGKNAAVLDAAAQQAPWKVVLAGPLAGPNGESIGLRNVQALGSLRHPNIVALMRRAAIFAAPSRYEPFGLAVAEAAICGAALVLADIPTFRELWDGAALFADPDDAGAWSDAFTILANDAPLRRRLAAESGVRARAFSLPRQVGGLMQVYAGLDRRMAA